MADEQANINIKAKIELENDRATIAKWEKLHKAQEKLLTDIGKFEAEAKKFSKGEETRAAKSLKNFQKKVQAVGRGTAAEKKHLNALKQKRRAFVINADLVRVLTDKYNKNAKALNTARIAKDKLIKKTGTETAQTRKNVAAIKKHSAALRKNTTVMKRRNQQSGHGIRLGKDVLVMLSRWRNRILLLTFALTGMISVIKESIDETRKQESALRGLFSVGEKVGATYGGLRLAAKQLVEDGLMPLSQAAEGLKNLLAANFNLEESINLMNAFKDSAAFGRQGTLGFGESIVGATQGLKNQNCLEADTLIYNFKTGESLTIEELHDFEEVPVVAAVDRKTGKLRVIQASYIHYNGKASVYEVELANGQTITATANHRFVTKRGMVFLEDLRDEDEILYMDQELLEEKCQKLSAERVEALLQSLNIEQIPQSSVVENVNMNPNEGKKLTIIQEPLSFVKTVLENSKFSFVESVKRDSVPESVLMNTDELMQPVSIADVSILSNDPISKVQDSVLGNVKDCTEVITIQEEMDQTIEKEDIAIPSRKIVLSAEKVLIRLEQMSRMEQEKLAQKYVYLNSKSGTLLNKSEYLLKCLVWTNKKIELLSEILKNTEDGDYPSSFEIPFDVFDVVENVKEMLRHIIYLGGGAIQNSGMIPETALPCVQSVTSKFIKSCEAHLMKVSSIIPIWQKIVKISYKGNKDVYDLTVPEEHNFLSNSIFTSNSIMVDNAGITKNLSIILKEAGFSMADLGRMTSDVNVRMAIYKGILKEAALFAGDASKVTATLSGKFSLMAATARKTANVLGEKLRPFIIDVVDALIDLNLQIRELGENDKVIKLVGDATKVIKLFLAAARGASQFFSNHPWLIKFGLQILVINIALRTLIKLFKGLTAAGFGVVAMFKLLTATVMRLRLFFGLLGVSALRTSGGFKLFSRIISKANPLLMVLVGVLTVLGGILWFVNSRTEEVTKSLHELNEERLKEIEGLLESNELQMQQITNLKNIAEGYEWGAGRINVYTKELEALQKVTKELEDERARARALQVVGQSNLPRTVTSYIPNIQDIQAFRFSQGLAGSEDAPRLEVASVRGVPPVYQKLISMIGGDAETFHKAVVAQIELLQKFRIGLVTDTGLISEGIGVPFTDLQAGGLSQDEVIQELLKILAGIAAQVSSASSKIVKGKDQFLPQVPFRNFTSFTRASGFGGSGVFQGAPQEQRSTLLRVNTQLAQEYNEAVKSAREKWEAINVSIIDVELTEKKLLKLGADRLKVLTTLGDKTAEVERKRRAFEGIFAGRDMRQFRDTEPELAGVRAGAEKISALDPDSAQRLKERIDSFRINYANKKAAILLRLAKFQEKLAARIRRGEDIGAKELEDFMIGVNADILKLNTKSEDDIIQMKKDANKEYWQWFKNQTKALVATLVSDISDMFVQLGEALYSELAGQGVNAAAIIEKAFETMALHTLDMLRQIGMELVRNAILARINMALQAASSSKGQIAAEAAKGVGQAGQASGSPYGAILGTALVIGASLIQGMLQKRAQEKAERQAEQASAVAGGGGGLRSGTRGGTITAQDINYFISPTVVFANTGDILIGSAGVTELGERLGDLQVQAVKQAVETGELKLTG